MHCSHCQQQQPSTDQGNGSDISTLGYKNRHAAVVSTAGSHHQSRQPSLFSTAEEWKERGSNKRRSRDSIEDDDDLTISTYLHHLPIGYRHRWLQEWRRIGEILPPQPSSKASPIAGHHKHNSSSGKKKQKAGAGCFIEPMQFHSTHLIENIDISTAGYKTGHTFMVTLPRCQHQRCMVARPILHQEGCNMPWRIHTPSK